MGRIKSTLVRRTAKQLIEQTPESFSKEFNQNKKALGRTMPSKRMRNKIAGQITRTKKNMKKIINEDSGSNDLGTK